MNRDKIYIPLIIVLAILFLWQWQCGHPAPAPVVHETVKTKIITLKGDSVFVPKPYRVTAPGPERIKEVVREVEKPGNDYQKAPECDTAAITDFYTVREYQDTVQTELGPIVSKNTVTENKLQLSEVIHNFRLPEKTIEKTTYLRSTKFFLGSKVFGNKSDFLNGFEVNAALETKGGKMYELGAGSFQGIGLVYSAGVKLKVFGK